MTSLHPKTHIGLVALTVANRERSVALYQDMPGITFIECGNAGVIMGIEVAAPLLLLTRAGEMAALRVARLNGQALLNEAVADLVVPSLDDVAVNALSQGLRP
jgi:catechol-2,3-dioxygenase